MKTLEELIAQAHGQGASDLHLEPGLPAAVRVRGELKTDGAPLPPEQIRQMARGVIEGDQWSVFLERRSFDLSKTIGGVRCRINLLHSARGVGFAIRLLAAFEATIEALNLHPDLRRFLVHRNGLLLVSGPTGSGKSSTLAALIQELNLTETVHILTIESPIEYSFHPRRAYIRQREVGRDTPSFEQALLDALREDPDVLMVGEMRDPQTIRLTLNAAETGHLVLATLHSSSCPEALQRVVSAFPPEIQANVAAQVADCLVGVVAQRLRFRPDLNLQVPECEILAANNPVRAHVRHRDFFKIQSVMETGASQGMWTFQRYRGWMERQTKWNRPEQGAFAPASEPVETLGEAPPPHGAVPGPEKPADPSAQPTASATAPYRPDHRIEIEPPEAPFGKILKRDSRSA